MAKRLTARGRVFKSSAFAKIARKADIEDDKLCVFVFLFAKKDRENIQDDELRDFRMLAKAYENLAGKQLTQLLKDKSLTEICHDHQA